MTHAEQERDQAGPRSCHGPIEVRPWKHREKPAAHSGGNSEPNRPPWHAHSTPTRRTASRQPRTKKHRTEGRDGGFSAMRAWVSLHDPTAQRLGGSVAARSAVRCKRGLAGLSLAKRRIGDSPEHDDRRQQEEGGKDSAGPVVEWRFDSPALVPSRAAARCRHLDAELKRDGR